MRLLPKIVLASLLPLLAIAVFTFLRLEELKAFQERQGGRRMESKVRAVIHDLDETVGECRRSASILAGLDEVAQSLVIRDVDVLYSRGRLFLNQESTTVMFIGMDGRVVARANDEYAFGDDVTSPLFRLAAQGRLVTGLVSYYGRWYVMTMAPVLRYGEKTVGVVAYGLALDEAMLERLAEEHEVQIAAAMRGRSVATTIIGAPPAAWSRVDFTWTPEGWSGDAMELQAYADFRAERLAVEDLRANMVASFVALGVIIVFGVYLLLRRLISPLRELAGHMDAFAAESQDGQDLSLTGDLVRITARRDEIGHLARSFVAMTERMRERRAQVLEGMAERENLAARLAEKNAQLLNFTAELERTIQNRTSALALARDTAEAANRAKTEFLAGVSHEIRTPLNSIVGLADLIEETESPGERREFARILKEAGRTLLGLISDVLDLSRIESGRLELDKASLHPAEVASQALEMVALRAREKHLQLKLEVGPDLPDTVVGDEQRLRQVLVNLLGNGVKFTDRGEVILSISRSPVTEGPDSVVLRFRVLDTGIGIAPDKQEMIFDSFTQADSSTTRMFGGFGLGLAISRRLVELMGGRLSVDSAPGAGSVFTFTAVFGLPRGAAPHPAVAARPAEVPADGPDRPRRLLIVEDSLDNRRLLELYLRKTSYAYDMAVNGAQAVDMFRSGGYDLVLMDIQMPVMDGYTATREIRRLELLEGRAPIPVVALTAHAMADDERRCLEAGCTAYLSKPIRREKLLSFLASSFSAK